MNELTATAASAASPLDAWQRLMAAYDAAKAADDDVNARYEVAAAAHEADKPQEPEIDLVLLGLTLFGTDEFVRIRLLHADNLDEVQANAIGATGVTRWERVNRDPLRIAEIDKVREFRRLYRESRERHNLSALEDEWDEMGSRLADATVALLLAPAPDYVAVRWKLDQLFGPDAIGAVGDEGRSTPCWNAELTDAVIADMARLAGEPNADRAAA